MTPEAKDAKRERLITIGCWILLVPCAIALYFRVTQTCIHAPEEPLQEETAPLPPRRGREHQQLDAAANSHGRHGGARIENVRDAEDEQPQPDEGNRFHDAGALTAPIDI